MTRLDERFVSGRPTACVLAGGRGTRLRSVVSDRPKPLADVGGRPFVSRLLDQLGAAGWSRVVLCTGYLAEAVEEALGDRYDDLELRYSVEQEALGTAGAIRLALDEVQSDPVLVLNGDSYCDVDLVAQVAHHQRTGCRATIALVEVPDAGRYGRVRIRADGEREGEGAVDDRIERFDEKIPDAGPGWINAGVYVLDRSVLEEIPAGRAVSMETEVFPRLIGEGMTGFRTDGRFLDIGTPESLSTAEAFFRRQR